MRYFLLLVIFAISCTKAPEPRQDVSESLPREEFSVPEPQLPTGEAVSDGTDRVGGDPAPEKLLMPGDAQMFSYVASGSALSLIIEEKKISTLEGAVKEANKFLQLNGYPYSIAVSDAKVIEEKTVIEVDGKALAFENWGESPCREGIVATMPIAKFDGPKVTVVTNGRKAQFMGRPLLATVKIKKKEIGDIPIPEEGFKPSGISIDGKTLYTKIKLEEDLTAKWWKKLKFKGKPFLILALNKSGATFVKDKKLYQKLEPGWKADDDTMVFKKDIRVKGLSVCER